MRHSRATRWVSALVAWVAWVLTVSACGGTVDTDSTNDGNLSNITRESAAGGGWELVSLMSAFAGRRMCLDVGLDHEWIGATLDLYHCNGTRAQSWEWRKTDAGNWFLALKGTNYCLNFPGADRYSGGQLFLYPCRNGDGGSELNVRRSLVGTNGVTYYQICQAWSPNKCVKTGPPFAADWSPLIGSDPNAFAHNQAWIWQ
jgi:hypothetical protein